MRFLFRGTIHSSWLIAIGSTAFLIGVAMCAVPGGMILASPWFGILGGVGCLVALLWHRSMAVILMLFSAGCLGAWHGANAKVELTGYDEFLNRTATVRGKVAEDIERGNSGELRLEIQDVQIKNVRLPGIMWVSASSRLEIKRSDIVILRGTVKSGFGNFPASMSFAKLEKIERPKNADIARDVRDGFSNGVRKVIKEPAASLGLGYVTGQQSALPPELGDQLKAVGLTHVVVASGYNLTILVRFARRLFARFSKFSSTMLASVMIAGFVLVTGFSPSMSRAALVTGLSLATWYYGRSMHPLVLLPFAAAITGIINPLFLWGDLGWYLSFVAFAGVIIMAPLVHDYFWGNAKAGFIRQILVDTSCAQLVTMPIIAFSFGQYALYALPANLLVLPLIPVTMLLTVAAGIAGLMAGASAGIIGLPAESILNYMIFVAKTIAELPGAQGEITFGVEFLVASYAILIGICLFLWRQTQHDFRKDNIVE
jgi:competence protein ComEC